jgi:hypothetical protein
MVERGLTLDEWRLRQGLSYRALGTLLGCQVNIAFAYCQEPGTKGFKRPGDDRMDRIFVISNGEVWPNSFYKLPKLIRKFDPKQPELAIEHHRAPEHAS